MSAVSAGDVVVLKSGSAPMTVQETFQANGKAFAKVVWEDKDGVHHEAAYLSAALQTA